MKHLKTKTSKLQKRFIIRKYIIATCAEEALKIEKKYKPDDCYIDERFLDQVSRENAPAIGFSIENEY